MFQVFFNGILGLTCIVAPVEGNPAVCLDHATNETMVITPEEFHQAVDGLAAAGVIVESHLYDPTQEVTHEL